MGELLKINQKIRSFNKKISIEGDKSLSIRWALLASQATGKSRAYKILKSDDVLSTLNCLKKFATNVLPIPIDPVRPRTIIVSMLHTSNYE